MSERDPQSYDLKHELAQIQALELALVRFFENRPNTGVSQDSEGNGAYAYVSCPNQCGDDAQFDLHDAAREIWG
jgi:hypothetical protein